MNTDLSLRLLARIMGWEDDRAREEYRWLNFIAELKYDSYRDFQAGMRFIESLVRWLQQFDKIEREDAYNFVRERLVYIGLSELYHLVEQFYPKVAQERIVKTVAKKRNIQKYEAKLRTDLSNEIDLLRRKTLFLGLSDGARIDVLRHNTTGTLSNEQLVPTTQLDPDKWQDLLADLREAVDDEEARFEIVFLIDDFTGTGTSFLRFDEEKGKWKGKLPRFKESISEIKDTMFGPDWHLCVHHYIASHQVTEKLAERIAESRGYFEDAGWSRLSMTYGTILPRDLPLSRENPADASFIALADKYYNPSIETKHTRVGGVKRINLGYGACALPLVLEHNTPNNSVALLWAEAEATQGEPPTPGMTPLFRRRQRHI